MRAADTNLLVRLLARDDPDQTQAAEEFVVGGAWVSHLVLAETIWVLEAAYGRSTQQLAAAISLVLDHESVSVQDGDVVALALTRFEAHPNLGFSDCLILEIARKAGHLPLGTFDRRLAMQDGATRLRT